MNKKRRKRIMEIRTSLAAVIAEIEEVLDEERTAFDRLPESTKDGERAMVMESVISALESAGDAIEECEQHLIEASQ